MRVASGGRVTAASEGHVSPAGALTVRVIEPLKPFRPWTVAVAVPEEPTSIEVGETEPIEMEKSGATVTVTGTSTVLLREPLLPVTVTVKPAAAAQVTVRTFPLFRTTVH